MTRRRYRLGLVGLNFGRQIVRNQLLSGPGREFFELTTLCDLDRAKADELASQHGLRVAESYAALLADPQIDAIGLFTGPIGRAALIDQALDAGKPVMTTKPFELDAAAALRTLQRAEARRIPVHLNSPAPLLTDDQRQMAAWREQYDLGQPVAVRFETYARYHETADGSWYDDPERCPVAPIYRLGIYAINELIRLVGPVDSVAVQQARLFTGRPTPDNAHLSLRFVNGALGSVFASLCIDNGRSYPNALCLHFERGTIWRNICWDDTLDRTLTDLRLTCMHDGRAHSDSACVLKARSAGTYDWEAFHRAVSGERLADAVTPDEIVAGVRVINAMREAERTGAMAAVAEDAHAAGVTTA